MSVIQQVKQTENQFKTSMYSVFNTAWISALLLLIALLAILLVVPRLRGY